MESLVNVGPSSSPKCFGLWYLVAEMLCTGRSYTERDMDGKVNLISFTLL